MSKIILKKLVLSNWRAQNREVLLHDDKTIVKGRNGSGKSSILHAWLWLLTGYTDCFNVKNHSLFDEKSVLSQDTPEASVKATLDINGETITIERSAKAKFTRPKGKSEWVKSPSDTYTYKIDEIAYSASDFNTWVNENICDSSMLTYCLSGDFFSTLCEDDKDKGRKVLERIVGEITNDDFKGNYDELFDRMKTLSVEKLIEQTKSLMKPLRDRLSAIPSIIENKESELQNFSEIDFEGLDNEIKLKKDELRNIDEEMLAANKKVSPILEEKRVKGMKLLELKSSLKEKELNYNMRHKSEVSELMSKIKEVKDSNESIAKDNATRKREFILQGDRIKSEKDVLATLNDKIEALREERTSIKSKVFSDTTCSYCGQPLPEDKVKELEKAFSDKKMRDLELITSQGKTLASRINVQKALIDELEKNRKAVEEKPLNSTFALEEHLYKLKNNFIPFENTSEYSEISKEIKEVEESIPSDVDTSSDVLLAKKSEIVSTLESLNRKFGLKSESDRLTKDIASLKAEIRAIGVNLSKHEGFISKCEEYIEERANIISNRVNKKLNESKIVMFSRMKNGEFAPDCIITNNLGVRFSTMNNSARLKTNIELQRMFCEHFNIDLPVMVDEAAVFSRDNLPSVDAQTVFFYATDDEKLIIE